MKETRSIMGMSITVEIVDQLVTSKIFDQVFEYFTSVDVKFSTYKLTSEVSRINRGEISITEYSPDMQTVLMESEKTKTETNGFFDITKPDGSLDPSGLVKGWAISHAAQMIRKAGFKNYYVEAGGDVQASGKNTKGEKWRVGIKNPFKPDEIVKVLQIENGGVATSGTYIRGQHIYNPHQPDEKINDILSLTVVGADIYDADRFATAAFAQGRAGIRFIENLFGFEGYMIDKDGIGTETSGLGKFLIPN